MLMTATMSMTAFLGNAVAGLPANEYIAGLLILVLGVALGIGLTCLLLVVHFLRKGRLAKRRLPGQREFLKRELRHAPAVYSVPNRWLAIKSGNPQLVQTALNLHNPTPCSWEEGLSVAQEHKLFVSPPVRGWILVMGSHLPDPGEDVDRCYRFIMDLSRKLGHVQYFSVNRAVHHHAWVQAEQGQVQRAYAWAGRTLWNQGKLSRAEMDLGLKCHDYGEGEARIDYGKVDPAAVNTERVSLLASRWSLDPTAIDARLLKESQGITGQYTGSKAH